MSTTREIHLKDIKPGDVIVRHDWTKTGSANRSIAGSACQAHEVLAVWSHLHRDPRARIIVKTTRGIEPEHHPNSPIRVLDREA